MNTQLNNLPEGKKFSRREWLQLATVGGSAVALYALLKGENDPQATSLQELLAALPHVGKVRVYPAAGATRRLVHLQQFHEAPNMSPEARACVLSSQKDLKVIVSALMNDPRTAVRKVFMEGSTRLSEENTRAIHETSTFISEVDDFLLHEALEKRSVLREQVLNSQDPLLELRRLELQGVEKEIAQLEEKLRKKKPKDDEDELRAMEALHKERGLELLHTEDLWANVAGSVAIERPDMTRADWEQVLIQRERIAIEAIQKRGGSDDAYMVYGAGHDFRKAIDEWNAAHPEQKISLLEIVPQSHLQQ